MVVLASGPFARAVPRELVHRVVARHAVETPHAIAVRHGDRSLTYGELVAQANQLAHALVARGAGAEARVVVCVEPGFDIVIALLGILGAGAVYVPIDPGYPAARIRAILDDTQPTTIVSRRELIDRLGLADFPTLDLDATAELASQQVVAPEVAIATQQTAYIYYTSGTTGRPKGVMASHANLAMYIDVARERYAIDRHEIMPAIARFSFSISMFELMSPLAAGGTLLVLDRDHILDPARMRRTFEEITFFHAGPSLLKHLLPYLEEHVADPAVFANVRHASSGGDMIPPELLEQLKRVFARAEVFVIYGCSEISCMGCTYPVPRDVVVTRTFVGRPFDGVDVRVVDSELRPVDTGVKGEVVFAGEGVVKGYLHRDELTAEKFIMLDGQRYYRTGDVGRVHADGWLELLGRNDFQIKVRGMRVELAEVEHHLRRAPNVRDAAAMAREAGPGDKVMTGYVVFGAAVTDRSAALAEVRRYMVDHVPDYMVPSGYMELERLPLNHNLKLDRHALPIPTRAEADLRAAETPTERWFAGRWQTTFGTARMGLDDNFFELGGDSLRALALIVDVGRELHATLEGMDVLRETLEVLAAICDRQRGTPAKPPRTAASVTHPVEAFHCGDLYCVLHPTAGPSRHAVLICAPMGQEAVRARFVLTRLARLLATGGTSVLQFDYFGQGDSLGGGVDATCTRWMTDIAVACDELRRRTNATRVTAVGARLGATLLSHANVAADRLVLWDPVLSGDAYHAELARLHQRHVRSLQDVRRGRSLRRIAGAEELLGDAYSEVMVRQLRTLDLVGSARPIRWLATHDVARQRAGFTRLAGERFETCGPCDWDDLARFEELMPDTGLSRALATLVEEAP